MIVTLIIEMTPYWCGVIIFNMYLLGSTKIQALNIGMLHGLETPSSKQVQSNVWLATTSMAAKIFVLMLLKNIA